MVTTGDALGDDFKGAIHVAVFGMAAAMTLWNLGRWFATGTVTHAVNTSVYLCLAGFEVRQIRVHWSPMKEDVCSLG